jgi:galactokinase
VTGQLLANRLADAGLDPAELRAKAALYDMALSAFHDVTGTQPRHMSWVPGRLEVFGKHTDYAGGRTLVAAVPRGIAIVCGPRSDRIVRVIDARNGESISISPVADTRSTGWRRYAEVVARRLASNFPSAPLAADIVFASDLPRASGMSSSSALIVGIAAALVKLADLESRAEWGANIGGPLGAAAYYACIENGHRFEALDGDAGVGTHGGSEDHTAILCGKPDRLSAYAFAPIRHIADVEVPPQWQLVIASSGVKAEKTGAAQQAYNRLARGVEILLALWNRHESACQSLATAMVSHASAPDRLREIVRGTEVADWTTGALQRRLEHFLREDSRVAAALHAFRSADRSGVSTLAAESQDDAETLIENQVPETVTLVRSARAAGAFAACSFGAGFGGSVWALADCDAAGEMGRRWHPAAFIATPGPSLTELA